MKEGERTAEELTGWCDRNLDARGRFFRFSGDVAAGGSGGDDRVGSAVRVLDVKSAKEDGHSRDYLQAETQPLSKLCDGCWNELRRIWYVLSKSLTHRGLFST